MVGDAENQPVSAKKSLSVIFDSHLNMDAQSWSSCKKAFYHLKRISQIKKFLTDSALTQLIHAFVISQIDYCNSLLAGLPRTSLNHLHLVQMQQRVWFRARENYTPFLPSFPTNTGFLCVQSDFTITLLTYRSLKRLAPRYLLTLLCLSVSSLLSCDRLISMKPRKKTYGNWFFQLYATQLLKSLPQIFVFHPL